MEQSAQFCGSSGTRTLFRIELTTGRARSITKFSFVLSEAEVLLPNCVTAVVVMLRAVASVFQATQVRALAAVAAAAKSPLAGLLARRRSEVNVASLRVRLTKVARASRPTPLTPHSNCRRR